ncbi:MAG TPA: hypothetical protein VJ140_04125 [Actinomycetota bacterium]|nr:hypothetical protein [Actinomycetota bacterium]
MTKEEARNIVAQVNEHVRIYGCRYQDGRWRHFCGRKEPRKEPDEQPAAAAEET